MTDVDVVLSEAAKSLTPLVPHDVVEDTNSATIVSASNRRSKNMKSRVRKVRGSSQRLGRERLQRSENIGEEKPHYKNYLAEQRAKRLQRFKSKGKYDGVNEHEVPDANHENTIERENGSGDSGRGVSAGSNGSKDEGIHSTGEKDEEHESERQSGKTGNARSTENEDDVDEGRGSINGDEDGHSSPTGEADDEASVHSDSAEKEDRDLDANGYHGDMDEPNSLANSYLDSLGVSSDAGLGTSYDLTLLRSGLEDMLGDGNKEDKEDGDKEGEGDKDEENKEGEGDNDEENKESNGDEENEEEGEVNSGKEEQNEEVNEEFDNDIKENMSKEGSDVETNEAEKESLHEMATEAESWMKDIAEEEEEDNEGKDEEEEGHEGKDEEEENGNEEKEEAESSGETENRYSDEWEGHDMEDEKHPHDDDERIDAQSDNESEHGTKEEEDQEQEKEDMADSKIALENDDIQPVEPLEKIDEAEETESQTESVKEDNDTEGAESHASEDAEAEKLEEESVEKKAEQEETNEDQGEEISNDGEAPSDSNVQIPESSETKDAEEEIQEVPAIAQMPGRYRRRNIPGKIAAPMRKSATSNSVDITKVAAKRRPISYRSGPIQTSSRPVAQKTINGRRPRRNFKAKPIHKNETEDKTVDGTSENEEVNDGESQISQDSQEERRNSVASEPLVPHVDLNTLGGNDISKALETSRSVGQLSQANSQDSLMDSSFQDLRRPRTAGKKYKDIKSTHRRSIGPKVSSSRKSSVSSQAKKNSSTSEVWVPEEDKLYVYTYSSQPRLLQVRRMGGARVATTDKWDNDPNSSFRLKIRGNGNPMYDRRVVRGSNYAKRIEGDDLPKWNPYFSNARSLTQVSDEKNETSTELSQSQQLRRQEFRQKLEARARARRETHGVSSLYPSHNNNSNNFHRNYARSHVHVQTENHYEPLERPPESDNGVQTDPWSEEGGFVAPPVAPTVPGVDATTQVYDAELDADSDDDILVAALVGRTMREAVFEVAREEQAEDFRINDLANASLSAFLKPEEVQENSTDKDEDEKSEKEATSQEREDPEGKETTPEGTVEVARTPDPRSPSPKHNDDVTDDQENESLVN